MDTNDIVFDNVKKIIQQDKKNVFNLLYYSLLDALLVLSIPLASSFVINSILAHASFSVYMLGFVIMVLFVFVTILQVIKEYIIEKFQQKVFLKAGIEIALKALELRSKNLVDPKVYKKLMNYFFDVISIQKVFPILLLDGVGVVIKMIVSMLLLLAFDPMLFFAGVVFFTGYIWVLLFLGRTGVSLALSRSDAKHTSIFFVQNIKDEEGNNDEILEKFDTHLSHYVKARQSFFNVIIKQLGFTYFIEGLIFTVFLVLGGYLVINGRLPLGEFVAAEIIVTSITYSLKGFVKQLDYIYDTIEGFYKVHKLSAGLGSQAV
jgi:ABC-type bacteriocin/lantibiotic exporter with double-glycine peptidase domain